jgi:hypothetical protein
VDYWCPWVPREEIQQTNAIDTLFILKWIRKLKGE